MQAGEIFEQRRSVRAYTAQAVSTEKVEQLLHWAASAPSAGALYPLCYILLREESQREAAVSATFCGARSDDPRTQKWILTAPVLLAVCGDLAKVEKKYGPAGLDVVSMLSQDCGAAVENILLGAVSLGLSACYVTGFRRKELAAVLKLPEHILPLALVPLGYSEKETGARPQRKVLLYEDRYGNEEKYGIDG